jgi:shikimate kinase
MVNIAMIGPRASGKSSLGPLLSAQLAFRFVETDELVLARFQESTVSEVWRIHGEPAWREAEADVASLLLSHDEQLISMGGGMPIISKVSQRMLAEQASNRLYVVYLDVDVQVLEERLSAGASDRPSLHGGDVIEEVAQVKQERDPVYRALADVICAIPSAEPIEETVLRLSSLLGHGGG